MCDTTFYVGGGEYSFKAKDKRVLRLARRIYRRFNPYPPDTIYHNIAVLKKKTNVRAVNEVYEKASPNAIDKLCNTNLFDLPPDLIFCFGLEEDGSCEDEKENTCVVGDRTRAFVFPDATFAKECLPNQAMTGERVVHALALVVEGRCTQREAFERAFPRLIPTNEEALRGLSLWKGNLFSIGRKNWKMVLDHVQNESVDPLYCNLPVVVEKRVVVCTLFYHQWMMSSPTCLTYRSNPEWKLFYDAYAFPHDILSFDTNLVADFVSNVSLRMDDDLYSIAFKMEKGVRVETPLPPPPAPPRDELVCKGARSVVESKRARSVVEKWSKSANATGLGAPTILQYMDAPTRKGCGGELKAERKRTRSECMDCGLISILREELGEEYAEEVLCRTLKDDKCGVYAAVRESDQTVVGCFILYFVEVAFVDGKCGCGVMIDSFAVKRSLQGKGLGGRMFHELCRKMIDSERNVVFAQCLTSKQAKEFWFDKLDDCGMARSLFLQAMNMCSGRVKVHTNCCAKARIYYG